MMVFKFSVFDQIYPFGENFVQKIIILSWNFVPKFEYVTFNDNVYIFSVFNQIILFLGDFF